ncbi:MAG: isoprenyl transferase [Acidobacteria bacterium]|nr:isoprenyl transferase [Acidobacteriota bacterium]
MRSASPGLDRREAEVYAKLKPALPQHVAIIMDGNGRWARRRHLPRVAGHRAGVAAVRSTVETAARIHIPALTLYAFSAENWKRPGAEVSFLMRLLRHYLAEQLPTLMRNNIRLDYIGRIHELPADVQERMCQARTETSGNSGMVLTLALNYGSRGELVDAVSSLVSKAATNGGFEHLKVSEEAIAQQLYTCHLPELDMVIRTSGEMRLSNFLLWQAAYAEIYVTEKLWPDFRGIDLLTAILEYQKRERRYGGISAQ